MLLCGRLKSTFRCEASARDQPNELVTPPKPRAPHLLAVAGLLPSVQGFHGRERGEGKNSPDDTWRTEFDGQVQGLQYEAKGQVMTPEGQVLRQCQLKLALPSS